MTRTEERKLLHAVERHRFQDELRHKKTKKGLFEASFWHLDHPIPGTDAYLTPSDCGTGAESLYVAVETEPLWMKLWVRARLALPLKGKRILAALEVDWRSRPAGKMAGCDHKTVDSWKIKFKMHFAQCHRAYERDLGE